MKWGDNIELYPDADQPLSVEEIQGALALLSVQAADALKCGLERLDLTKPTRISWTIEQDYQL